MSNDHTIAIEFDHWTDSCHRSLLGIIALLNGGQQHIISLEDVSLVGQSVAVMESSTTAALSKISLEKFNSLVSDSASNCVITRNEICKPKDHMHIIQHRCYANWVNLIMRKITESSGMKDLILEALKSTNFLSTD